MTQGRVLAVRLLQLVQIVFLRFILVRAISTMFGKSVMGIRYARTDELSRFGWENAVSTRSLFVLWINKTLLNH